MLLLAFCFPSFFFLFLYSRESEQLAVVEYTASNQFKIS